MASNFFILLKGPFICCGHPWCWVYSTFIKSFFEKSNFYTNILAAVSHGVQRTAPSSNFPDKCVFVKFVFMRKTTKEKKNALWFDSATLTPANRSALYLYKMWCMSCEDPVHTHMNPLILFPVSFYSVRLFAFMLPKHPWSFPFSTRLWPAGFSTVFCMLC